MSNDNDRSSQYDKGSLSLAGTVMLGTGVMIGAGIFALTGQKAEMTGGLFSLAFLAVAVIVSFSAYSYIKISNAYPSAGGIAMYLHKAYGDRLPTAFNALLMYCSMVMAQSFLTSIFAVSRMLAMLTEMKLVPHSHLGMSGSIQNHTLAYTVVLGLILTAFFDLSRIAALGIVFYLIMDIAIHWGVIRYLSADIEARAWVPATAIFLDLLVLGGFVWVKLNSDPLVIGVAVVTMALIAFGEYLFLRSEKRKQTMQL